MNRYGKDGRIIYLNGVTSKDGFDCVVDEIIHHFAATTMAGNNDIHLLSPIFIVC